MTLTTWLSIGQLACVFVLWLVAYKAINDREHLREDLCHSLAITVALRCYIKEKGLDVPDYETIHADVERAYEIMRGTDHQPE